MVKYVFHYLNVRGLGECARLILHYAGCEFEDHRMEFAELNKDELPFGKVPVLEVDGKKLPESFAINRYLAKQTGLGGSDDFESAEIDSIAYLWKDFLDAILPFILVVMGRRKGDKEQMREEHLNPALNHYIPIFERLLKESDNGYLHSSGLSWADFFASNITFNCRKFMPDDINKHQTLIDHCDRVHSLPRVNDYVANRPDTSF